MRLRHLTLALIALGGIWLGVLIQRSHHAPKPVALAQPRAAAAAPRVKHVPGLDRPVAVTPIVKVQPVLHHVTPAPKPRRVQTTDPRPARPAAPEPNPFGAVAIEEDSRTAAVTPPPPPEPLEITAAQTVAVTSSSVRVTWRTSFPARTQAAFGLDTPAVYGEASNDLLVEHESSLKGLDYSTDYQIYLHAVDEWNRSATTTLTISTGPMAGSSSARTQGDDIVVDDRPFFPTAVWAQCSDGFGSNIDDGINLFMGDGCNKNDLKLAGRLDGRAYSIVNAEEPDVQGRGVIGWYYPDEWDAFLESTVKREDLADSIVGPRAGRISFLTLTNHFYSRAEPLPQGKGMYPVLFSIPDVVGFDLYPLQVWCRPAFGDVFDSQRELRSATGGKPTFQWIEVAPMEHPCKNHSALNPTPATVRAETWLSIGGGAGAVGYFPNRWNAAIGDEIRRTNREIKALAPALLAADMPVRSDTDAVRVSARALNGALYVIAVNTTETTLQAKISVEGIAGRSATTFGGGATVGADETGFSDSFGPLAARVYVIPPQGW